MKGRKIKPKLFTESGLRNTPRLRPQTRGEALGRKAAPALRRGLGHVAGIAATCPRNGVSDFSWVPVSLCPQDKESGRGFCSFYRAGRIKGGLPCGGRKGVARSEPNLLSPSTELERRGATSGSRFEGHEVIGFVPAAGGFRSLRRSAQVGARPGAARPHCGRAAPRATRRFLCPAFFGSRRQRKRAGFCSFWPGSKRRRMRTTQKCPGMRKLPGHNVEQNRSKRPSRMRA